MHNLESGVYSDIHFLNSFYTVLTISPFNRIDFFIPAAMRIALWCDDKCCICYSWVYSSTNIPMHRRKDIREYVKKSHRLASFNAVAPKFRRLIKLWISKICLNILVNFRASLYLEYPLHSISIEMSFFYFYIYGSYLLRLRGTIQFIFH